MNALVFTNLPMQSGNHHFCTSPIIAMLSFLIRQRHRFRLCSVNWLDTKIPWTNNIFSKLNLWRVNFNYSEYWIFSTWIFSVNIHYVNLPALKMYYPGVPCRFFHTVWWSRVSLWFDVQMWEVTIQPLYFPLHMAKAWSRHDLTASLPRNWINIFSLFENFKNFFFHYFKDFGKI